MVMNARDRWLASFSSENTRDLYVKVFDMFWGWAQPHYSPLLPSSGNVDPYDWLVEHRSVEVGKHSPYPLHCERIVTAWMSDLGSTDLEPSSRVTYAAVLSAIFGCMFPRHRGVLRLPLEPSDGVS
jgi:hypothetical protein